MCQRCDMHRTVRLLLDLASYVNKPGADREFADVTAKALSASLPAPRTGDGLTPPPASGEEW